MSTPDLDITLEDVYAMEKKTKFAEPPAYAVLTISKWNNGGTYANFSVHKSLTAVKTHISACSKDYGGSYSHRGKARKEDFLSRGWFRVYEYHGSDGWIPVYDIQPGVRFQLEHELWTKGAAPKEKVAAPEQDVAAAIASIVGVGGQQENEA